MTVIFLFIKRLLPLIMLIAIIKCSEKVAGAGSETTNSITGTILKEDGSPAHNTVVKLFQNDFNPLCDKILKKVVLDTTDPSGKFQFDDIDEGTYSILARNESNITGILISGISFSDSDSLKELPPECLLGCGSVSINLSELMDSVYGFYVPGTDIYSHIDTTDSVILNNIPSCILQSVNYVTNDDNQYGILRYNVPVNAHETFEIANPAWKYSRSIVFNTSSSGANISENVHNFPVLLRLNPQNFNFLEANPYGNDLLFTKEDNTPLPFEIERWDLEGNHAEIWVLLDTLKGNSSEQSITMYWGNPYLSIAKTDTLIFNTKYGFEGVWHLASESDDSTRDATNNMYHGISYEMTETSTTEGIIGNCREFNGSSQYISIPNSSDSRLNFPQDGNFTISAWVYLESYDSMSHVILSKGNLQYFLWYTSIHLNSTLWQFANYHDNSGWSLTGQPVSSNKWVLLTGVRIGSAQYLYVNGELADTVHIDYPFFEPRDATFDLMIGRFAQVMASPTNNEGYCYFKGRIDEVRISSTIRDSSWIRLCYINQQPENRFISFK